jgi:hypothetical protein
MRIIEAIITRSALDDFSRCARQLGILAFDLIEERERVWDHCQALLDRAPTPDTPVRLKVDFAVPDKETKSIVHAVLESAHPDSIGIFKFEQNTRSNTSVSPSPIHSSNP